MSSDTTIPKGFVTHKNFLILSNARHHAIHHAADDLGRVLQTLVHAQLDVLAAQKHRVPTEDRSACLAGHSGTGTALREHHCDRLGI